MADSTILAFFISLLAGTVRLATPILLPALGQIYTQRAGILNLGTEGTMLMGAVCGFTVASVTGSLWLGMAAGIMAGIAYSLIMAWLSVTMRANQVVAGIGMNILSTGLAVYIYRLVFGIRTLPPSVVPFPTVEIPVLSKIPVLGTILFSHNIIVYLTYVLVLPLSWFVLEKTTFGLKIKAVGENPRAADSKGVNVGLVRYLSVLIGGAYAGAGGAFMTIAYMNTFTEKIIGGFGFIAVSVVIFARFKPVNAAFGALIFGMAQALQLRLQAQGIGIPSQFLLMLPYIMTIIALVIASKKAEFPSAYTIPYSRLDR